MDFVSLYTDRLDEELGTDDSTRLFTTRRRKFAINEGMRQFADLTECYLRDSSRVLTHGQGEYELTSNVVSGDFIRLSKQLPEYRLVSSGASGSTQYTAGPDLKRTTVQWLDQYEPGWRNSTGGTPRYYYERMDGGKRLLGLTPPPQIGTSQVATLRVPYVARPSSMTDDTHVPFTNSTLGTRTDLRELHQAFAHYGAYQLEKLRMQKEESGQQLQAFMGYVQRFLGALRPKGGTTIKVSRNYFGDARSRGPVGGLNSWPTDRWGDR